MKFDYNAAGLFRCLATGQGLQGTYACDGLVLGSL